MRYLPGVSDWLKFTQEIKYVNQIIIISFDFVPKSFSIQVKWTTERCFLIHIHDWNVFYIRIRRRYTNECNEWLKFIPTNWCYNSFFVVQRKWKLSKWIISIIHSNLLPSHISLNRPHLSRSTVNIRLRENSFPNFQRNHNSQHNLNHFRIYYSFRQHSF